MMIVCVCTGNTCRSPMAAALLRRELDRVGRPDVQVESAGLAADGSPATPQAGPTPTAPSFPKPLPILSST